MNRELLLVEFNQGCDYAPVVFFDNGNIVFEGDSTHFNGFNDYVEGYCKALGLESKDIAIDTVEELEEALKLYPFLSKIGDLDEVKSDLEQ